MLVAIIFGGFENITFSKDLIWRLSEEIWWGPYLFHLVTTNFCKFINSPISPNKSSPIIYSFTVHDICNLIIMINIHD